MAYLVVLKGQNAKQSISLEKDRIVLGRNATCDVVFPANDFAVSREHACIVRVQNKYFLEDLGSRNGTFLNNQQVTARQPLKDSDKIRICDFLYSFHETPQLPAAPTKTLAELSEADATIDEADDFSTFEASVSNSSQVFLEAQPAERLRIILDITSSLSKTLELDNVLPKIVESLFQVFKQADRGFIILREETVERDKTVERLIPKVIKARRTQDETTASFSKSIVRECLKTAQAFLCDDATQDKRFTMAQSIADFRIRSVMCAPLWSPDTNKAFGVIQLDTQDRGKKFTQEDLNFLMAIASSASVVLDNARMHEISLVREREQQNMKLAHEVQLSFLPKANPELPSYEFYSAYEPALAVGGDYYGFIPIPGAAPRLAILVGDVAGKGVPAALLMAKLSSDARFSLVSEADPAKAISVLNDLLYPNTSQMDRFVTLAGALLDYQTHTVTMVNAGHPSALLIRANATEAVDTTTTKIIGLPLGVMEGYPYESHQITLEPGDTVLLFSDGMTEAMDKSNKQMGYQAVNTALKEGARSPQALVERIMKLLRQFAAGRSQHDDITLVCFGRNA
jgi:serine phosphatase RsbU (regulator of sigma subunit)